MTTTASKCEICGGPVLPILYGFPTPEAVDAAERGEFILGGCVLGPSAPRSRCECGATETYDRRDVDEDIVDRAPP